MTSSSSSCPHCGGDKAIRNPRGDCDHLYYPEQCEECVARVNRDAEQGNLQREAAIRDFWSLTKLLSGGRHARCCQDMRFLLSQLTDLRRKEPSP